MVVGLEEHLRRFVKRVEPYILPNDKYMYKFERLGRENFPKILDYLREYAMVVCNGKEYFVRGGLLHVEDSKYVDKCASEGKRVFMKVHTHPGGTTLHSLGDYYTLMRELKEGTLPQYSCVCRRTYSDEFKCMCLDLRNITHEKLEELTEYSIEEYRNYLALMPGIDYIETEIGDTPVTIDTNEGAEFIEERFKEDVKKTGVRLLEFRIEV